MENGWFTEKSELWPNQRFSMKVNKVLHEEKSQFQNIQILQTQGHGRALILDGIIQCTEHDEFAYQEMISLLPLNCHSEPRTVLIVGGGDGGVAREVDKHPSVQTVHQAEIDARVIEVSKQYLPFMAKGFGSPKLQLHVADGLEFIRNHPQEFDVIITDSSDPIGPAVCLFNDEYFRILKNAIKDKGIICSQGSNPFTCPTEVRDLLNSARKSFSNVAYAIAHVPTYPSGIIGFVLATNDDTVDFTQPKIKFTEKQLDVMNLKYYSENVHRGAFALPRFIEKILFK